MSDHSQESYLRQVLDREERLRAELRKTEAERDALRRWARHHQWESTRSSSAACRARGLHHPQLKGGLSTGHCAECFKPTPCPTIKDLPSRPDKCDCSADCPWNARMAMGSNPDGTVWLDGFDRETGEWSTVTIAPSPEGLK